MAGVRTPDIQTKSTLDTILGNKDSGAGVETAKATVASVAAQIGSLLQISSGVTIVEDKDLSAPPVSPTVGDRYIVKATGTGAWAGHDNDVAEYTADGWSFTDPEDGYRVFLRDEKTDYYWDVATSKWTVVYSADLAFATKAAMDAVTGMPANVRADVVSDVIATTANRARTSNVATIVTGAAHGLSTGAVVNVRSLADSTFNANQVTITVTNTTTFTYANTGSNVTTTADTGGQVDRNGVYASDGAGAWDWVGDSDVSSSIASLESSIDAINDSLDTTIGTSQQIGLSTVETDGSFSAGAGSFIFADPVAIDGVVETIEIYSAHWSKVPILVVTKNVDDTINLVERRDVWVDAGYNKVYVGDLQVRGGQYIGIYAGASGYAMLRYTSSSPHTTYWFVNAAYPTTDTAVSVVTAYGLKIRFTVANKITGEVAIVAPQAFESADPIGVVDASLSIKNAQEKDGLVPRGLWSAPDLRNSGYRLYGSGGIISNGVRLALPRRPIHGSLWHRARAALMSQIDEGAMLCVLGDSISQSSYASTGDKHYINLLCRWLNLGIALDEPVFNNWQAAGAYTLAFYGVAVSGTVVLGTSGPISTSLLLQPGQAITVVGAYEQIDVAYKQQATSGTLSFAYNATPYKTVDTTGATDLDHFSGPSATGQTASGTYTITNTHGSNAVEITGLYRLGVKTASSPARLYVGRFAHSGWAIGNYGSTQITSILKQASAYGGAKHKFIVFLGANNMASSSYATAYSQYTALLGLLTSGGIRARDILCAAPWRWNIYAYANFEHVSAAIRNAAADAGCPIIPLDAFDIYNFGYADTTNDVHPNDNGEVEAFELIANYLAGTL